LIAFTAFGLLYKSTFYRRLILSERFNLIEYLETFRGFGNWIWFHRSILIKLDNGFYKNEERIKTTGGLFFSNLGLIEGASFDLFAYIEKSKFGLDKKKLLL